MDPIVESEEVPETSTSDIKRTQHLKNDRMGQQGKDEKRGELEGRTRTRDTQDPAEKTKVVKPEEIDSDNFETEEHSEAE